MNLYLVAALIVFLYMSFWFILSLIKKRNDIADIAWGLGFILLAWSSLYLSGSFHTRAILVDLLVTIWGLRLAYHVFKRNWTKPEDYRYQAWRQQWGNWFYLRSYLQVFLLQGFFMFLIALPVLFINFSGQGPAKITDFVGLLIWLIGFAFEAIGDRQLKDFVRNKENKGKLMQTGLWKYSRHPNYFGEITLWWGIGVIAMGMGAWFTTIGPLTITILLRFVSGVPLLEKKYEGRADWEEYKRKTSVLIPMRPKKR